MLKTAIIILLLIFHLGVFADLKYHPIKFKLSTEKELYEEGEKITFLITITNSDKEKSYPVLVPHTQNTGQKLFYLNLYDKANNTSILRATENKMIHMMVHDTGRVMIRFLKPLEQITIPIYWNDFENYYSYLTQTASHHSFGVPLFAGVYKINICYNPNGIALGDSIYTYYNHTEQEIAPNKLAMPSDGELSNTILLKIKKSANSILLIEGKKYCTHSKERDWCWYYLDSIGNGGTNERLVHITSLAVDSFTQAKNEYFYSHFTNVYAEFITRFENGDIQEYRKFRDNCPDEFLTERYNENKQKYYYAIQLPDGRFYNVTYLQPSGNKKQEMYYSADGKLCTIIDYIYNKQDGFLKTKTSEIIPCIMDEL
jgi:hypothetical protein